MKAKTAVILVVSCFLLAAIGLGVEDIYCSYFSGVSGLRQYQLVDDQNGAVVSYYLDEIKTVNSDFVEGLSAWAQEHEAALVVSEAGSRGQAVLDGSGRIMRILNAAGVPEGSPKLDASMRGVYVADDPAFVDAYVADGVFLPSSLGLPVLGYYDPERMPRNFRRSFFYPLSVSLGHGDYFMTDARGDVDELVELILKNNDGKAVNRRNDYGGAIGFIGLLFKDPMTSRSRSNTFYTCLALALSFLFSGAMLFREYRRELIIRRRFGMPFRRVWRNALLIGLAVLIVSLLVFAFLLEIMDLIDLDAAEKFTLIGVLAAVGFALEAAVIAIGMAGIGKNTEGGGKNEGVLSGGA